MFQCCDQAPSRNIRYAIDSLHLCFVEALYVRMVMAMRFPHVMCAKPDVLGFGFIINWVRLSGHHINTHLTNVCRNHNMCEVPHGGICTCARARLLVLQLLFCVCVLLLLLVVVLLLLLLVALLLLLLVVLLCCCCGGAAVAVAGGAAVAVSGGAAVAAAGGADAATISWLKGQGLLCCACFVPGNG
jgi:hypothetical protein